MATTPDTFAQDIGARKRKSAVKAAAAEREPSTESKPSEAVAQVMDGDPIVSLPEPFPMDFPFLALQQHIDQMENMAHAQFEWMRKSLATVEKAWPRLAGVGTPVLAGEVDMVEAVTEAVQPSFIVCTEYEEHRSSHQFVDGRWTCILCSAKPVAVEGQWECPEHHIVGEKHTSKRTGKVYYSCPAPGCVEVAP